MKIYEGHDETGKLVYIEVANSFVSRKTIIKIIESIPNVHVIRKNLRDDVFCEFKVNERVFKVMEPFGDNSRYHIGEKEIGHSAELQIIKEVFSSYKPKILKSLKR